MGAVYVLIIAIILYIIGKVIKIINQKKMVESIYAYLKGCGYIIEEAKKNNYSFKIHYNDKVYYIKLAFVPTNSSVTINYKDTFELKYGGRSSNVGRNYPKKRYLNELVPFLNSNYNGEKFVIICPKCEQILKYLNESDIAVVRYTDVSYGMKVMTLDDFKSHITELIK